MMVAAFSSGKRRLAGLTYQSVKDSHIHLLWPRSLPDKNAVTEEGLWHLCPAHVYESRVNSDGQVQVVVNFENCIKCETCWRGSDLVDWARDGRHRFSYAVHTPVAVRLVEAAHAAAASRPALPRITDPWEATARRLAEILKTEPPGLVPKQEFGTRRTMACWPRPIKSFLSLTVNCKSST